MDDPDRLLQAFLDGDLPPDQEEEVLAQLTSQPALGDDAVPSGFADRVMQQVALEAEPREQRAWQSVRAVWDFLIQSRTVTLRPVYALGAVMILAVILVVFWEQALSPSERVTASVVIEENAGETAVWVRFTYLEPEAHSVAVAGDFSNWEPIPLREHRMDDKQVWTAQLQIPRGEHRYMFVVNETTWVTDPLAGHYRDDGFGKTNAILQL